MVISGAITNVGMRSHLSRIVDKDELGKVFSLIASLDATAPLLASVFFTLIFTQTLDFFPGAVFEATAVMLFVPLFVMIWIDINYNNNNNSDNVDSNRINGERKQKSNKVLNKENEHLAYRTSHNGLKIQLSTDL
jgi:hypothetical protein